MRKKKRRIAILGATSHIAKGLILNFCRNDINNVYLFARSIQKAEDFLFSINCKRGYPIKSLCEFGKERYDVIINCVGIGDSILLKDKGMLIFELTENYDNAILNYLKGNEESIYINFSSGAVYGKDFLSPADIATGNTICVNKIDESHYYSMAKLNSEIKHRSYKNLRIVDLRVFAYFSRFIDLKTSYLITGIINSIRKKKVFMTGNNNIVRDYIGSDDLFSLVCRCIEKGGNDVYDVYSRKPVKKFDILKSFRKKFGLNYEISESVNSSSITGTKDMYCSRNRKAKELGYTPQYTSLELLIKETAMILNKGGDS